LAQVSRAQEKDAADPCRHRRARQFPACAAFDFTQTMLLLRARQKALLRAGARSIVSSPARLGGSPPFAHMPPPPPPEFLPDGSPKKYPLHQPIWDHGYEWEHWMLLPAGVFHTVYHGDFAQDFPPYWAWLMKFPMWVVSPFLILWAFLTMVVVQNLGSIGIKPKRFTIEWMQATKERERIENTNPVQRYLDRRKSERGGAWLPGYRLFYTSYFPWMRNAHDPDYPEYYLDRQPRPHLHWTDDLTKSFKVAGDADADEGEEADADED